MKISPTSRAFGRFRPSDTVWRRADGRFIDAFRPRATPEGFERPEEVEDARSGHLDAVRRMFKESRLFIFTLGLTEAWTSVDDGAVYPVPPGVISMREPNRNYGFRNFTVQEIVDDFREFASIVTVINPDLRILLTVSPVPLVATYENEHVLSATTYSKSVLRAAAGEICRNHNFVDYLPSFEIITNWYNHGGYFEDDLRSVTKTGIDHVMRVFHRNFLNGRSAAEEMPQQVPHVLGDREYLARAQHFLCDDELLDATISHASGG